MSDTRGLLDRISAFRQRLEQPDATPESMPIDPTKAAAVVTEAEVFRQSLHRIAGTSDVPEGPLPQFTGRAQRLLVTAKQLLDRQRAFTTNPHFAGLSAPGAEPDPIVGYHRETVAVLDSAVRLARVFPDSPSAQLKLCDGLDGLLGIVQDRLVVQERTLAQRLTDADRIDRLAGFFTALYTNQPAALQTGATTAEELLEDARQAKPIRYVSASPDSTSAYPGAAVLPAPARFIAAHAINVAQIIARVMPFDYEWAARPLPPVVAALLMDCGMLGVPVDLLAKREGLTPEERRIVEVHPKAGAELDRKSVV